MLDFPVSPSLNQYYTYGIRSWQWNGSAWILVDPFINASTLNGYSGDFYRNAANLTGMYTGVVSGSVTTGQVVSLAECIEDTIGDGFFTYSKGVTGQYNDAGGTYSLSGVLATTLRVGVASFNPTYFTVSSDGDVEFVMSSIVIPAAQVNDFTEAVQDVVGANGFIQFGTGVSGAYNDAGNAYTISGRFASTTQHGVARFDSTDFATTDGVVTINNAGVSIPSTQITDWAEAVQDTVGAAGFITFGTGVSGAYNDGSNTYTLSGKFASTTEHGVSRYDSTDFSVTAGVVTVNNAGISIPSTQVTDWAEAVQDTVGATNFIYTIQGISGIYNDTANTYTLSGIQATNLIKGVASFDLDSFTVTGGHVTIPLGALEYNQLTQSTGPFILGSAADAIPDYPTALSPTTLTSMLTGFKLETVSTSHTTSGSFTSTGYYHARTFNAVVTSGTNVLVHLPNPASCSGRIHIYKKISADTSTVTISGAPFIDGDAQPFILYRQWDSVSLVAADSWYVTSYHFE